jgi:hypothetical protein
MGLYLLLWAESLAHLMGQRLVSAQFSGPFVRRARGAGRRPSWFPQLPPGGHAEPALQGHARQDGRGGRRAVGSGVMPSGRWRRRRRRRRRRSVSKPYETRGRGSGERPRIHFPPLRDVTRVRRNLFGRVFSRFGAAAGRGGHRSHGRRGEAKPARDEPRTVDAWTEEAARGAAAGGRTSERVVHAQVCEGKANAKMRRAGCNFHFFT